MTHKKHPVSTVPHHGSRAAIERCRNRQIRVPSKIELTVMDHIGRHELLPATVKASLLKRRNTPQSSSSNPT